MPTFPAWFIATLVAGAGVWLVAQWDTQAAWFLAILVVLGVLIFRDAALTELNALLASIFSGVPGQQTTAPVNDVQ